MSLDGNTKEKEDRYQPRVVEPDQEPEPEQQVTAATKKCFHCAMEIPAKATICPYSRKSDTKLGVFGEGMLSLGCVLMLAPFAIGFIILLVVILWTVIFA